MENSLTRRSLFLIRISCSRSDSLCAGNTVYTDQYCACVCVSVFGDKLGTKDQLTGDALSNMGTKDLSPS